MDLKQFVSETISSIVDAVVELQNKYDLGDVLINPPTTDQGGVTFGKDSKDFIYRHVRDVSFDVAVSVGSESAGSMGGGIKIFSVDISGKNDHSKSAENVSRVSFSIPIAFPETFCRSWKSVA